MYFKKSGFGLKSIMNSLSITPDLSPGLLDDLKNRALAQNSFLFMIPDSHLIFFRPKPLKNHFCLKKVTKSLSQK